MSINSLTLTGVASGKTKKLTFTEIQSTMNLLLFLQVNDIPIASSCSGRAVCQKCKVNGSILACEYSVLEFIQMHGEKISIDYI